VLVDVILGITLSIYYLLVNNNNNDYFNCQVYLALLHSNRQHCELKLIQIKFNQIQVFEGRGKPEYPGEKVSEQRREPTNSIHTWRLVWKSNPGHIGDRRELSPPRHHCSPYFILFYLPRHCKWNFVMECVSINMEALHGFIFNSLNLNPFELYSCKSTIWIPFFQSGK